MLHICFNAVENKLVFLVSLHNLLQGEFDWSREFRSHVLSAYFYGNLVVMIIGGRLSGRYGGKHVIGTGFLLSVVSTVLTPQAARLQAYLVIVLRVLLGIGSVSIARCRLMYDYCNLLYEGDAEIAGVDKADHIVVVRENGNNCARTCIFHCMKFGAHL